MKTFFAPAALLASVAFPCSAAASTVNLSMNPLIAEVRIQPGANGAAQTVLSNNGDEPEHITVRRIDWTTRVDGGISIERYGAEGARSLTPFLQCLSYEFVLQPHESRSLSVSVVLPASFPRRAASYWGGLYVKATPLDRSTSAIGPAATFFVYNDVGNPERKLVIRSLHASAGGSKVQFVSAIKNEGQGYLRIGGSAMLMRAGKTIDTVALSVGAVFPGRTRIVRGGFDNVARGTYTLETRYDYGGAYVVAGDTRVVVP